MYIYMYRYIYICIPYLVKPCEPPSFDDAAGRCLFHACRCVAGDLPKLSLPVLERPPQLMISYDDYNREHDQNI